MLRKVPTYVYTIARSTFINRSLCFNFRLFWSIVPPFPSKISQNKYHIITWRRYYTRAVSVRPALILSPAHRVVHFIIQVDDFCVVMLLVAGTRWTLTHAYRNTCSCWQPPLCYLEFLCYRSIKIRSLSFVYVYRRVLHIQCLLKYIFQSCNNASYLEV